MAANNAAATTKRHRPRPQPTGADHQPMRNRKMGALSNGNAVAPTGGRGKPSFMTWTLRDVVHVAIHHWLPCIFGFGLLFFMGVEYTLTMVPSSSPPFDLGFVVTRHLNQMLASWPELNTVLAALNTVFVGMQTTYILWSWLVEGRTRATISALFMFTCRGILGYTTQLPLPENRRGEAVHQPIWTQPNH